MPGLYSDDLKRRVREGNNIVDVVQSVVGKLVRSGRSLKACCPFHNEKTPSFYVHADGQYFHCFGCQKNGDVFTFVMLHERVEFPEALKILADRAGITVETTPQAAAQYKKETDWKSYLYRLNDAAAKFYREQLFSKAGKEAREYLKKRGLNDELCEQFGIGYAPAGGSPLLQHLQGLKAPPKAIVLAGLVSERDDGSLRDFFYDRLMFPIHDMQGRVIAFGGRILGLGEPKYLNTRETHLFSKTKTVYALHHAKEEIIKTRRAILVEGYTDVMMCHQFGITNVVACLGTAITAEHIRQLRRVADELVLLTDADAAGAKASERSLPVLFQEEMPARIARLPGETKDPCEFLLAEGRDSFVKALEAPQDLFEYKFASICKGNDLLTPQGVKKAADELMALISVIPDTLLRNRYRYEVMKRLNVSERDLVYEAQTRTASATTEEAHNPDIGVVPPPENELARAERELLSFLFHEPAWMEEALGRVDLAVFQGGPEAVIAKCMLESLNAGKLPPDPATITEGNAGSLVAREVLERLQAVAEDGIVKSVDAAKALSIALAEAPPKSASKLQADQRLQMVVKPLKAARLQRGVGEANRRWTDAKIRGDADAEASAYTELVTLRKQLKLLDRQPLQQ